MRTGSGVSVDMHVTFLNSAKEGEVVEVRGIVDKLGKRMVSCISRDVKYYRYDALVFYRRLRGLRFGGLGMGRWSLRLFIPNS